MKLSITGIVSIVLLACIPYAVNAQFMFGGGSRPNLDSLRKITAVDYADMLAKVGVGHEAGPNWPFFLDFFEREVVSKD